MKLKTSISSTYITHLLALLCFFTAIISEAQTKKQVKKDLEAESQGYILRDVEGSNLTFEDERGVFHFNFPNINKVYFYYDETKKANIKALSNDDTKQDQLIVALEDYVKHFGIKNFETDLDVLWELAQLYEKFGMRERARACYFILLKHHKTDSFKEIKQYFEIRSYFDSTTVLEKDYYVPLDYYYELVEYRKKVDSIIPPKSVLLNMGDLINKKNIPDYGPSINRMDDFMIYTRKQKDENVITRVEHFNEDLYYSKNYDGFWDESVKFPTPINSKCNEGSAAITKDGKTIYFSRCFVKDFALDCSDCLGKCDIYVTHLENDGKWSKPANLGVNVNTKAWESHPSLSTSEDTLYFASDREGGFGLSDIYFTYKNRKGKWMPAQNVGPIINTRNNEYSPFINWVHGVFYFSSNGHLLNFCDLDNKKKYRTLDIYKTKIHRDYVEEPKNVGPLVNGAGNEFYFSIDSKAEFLYYAKTEEEATDNLVTDIFSFPVPMEARPDANVRLHGKLTDRESGNPYKAVVSVIDLENGIEVAPKQTRPDGTYDFDLINHKNYLLILQGDDFFRIENLFELNGDTTIETKATSIRNKKLQFTSLVFENGKSNILPEMHKDLKDVINFLIDNPDFDLSIAGHTDLKGDQKANLKLSQDRADAIKEYIITEGFIASERISAIGYGSTKPIKAQEITAEDASINRRVEFEIHHNGERIKNNGTQYSDEDFQDNQGSGNDW